LHFILKIRHLFIVFNGHFNRLFTRSIRSCAHEFEKEPVMSNMFTSRNPAGVAAGQTAAIFGVLAAGAVNAHMSGLQAMRQARESNNSHVLRHQLGVAINRAQDLCVLICAES
jgi:hypothetical protein